VKAYKQFASVSEDIQTPLGYSAQDG